MSTLRKMIKNFLSLSLAQLILHFVSFLVTMYLARLLAPANFGKIGFAQAVVAYFMLIPNLGLITLGVREIARNKDDINIYASNIVTLRLILAFLSFGLLLIFINLINKPMEIKYLITFYGLVLFSYALLTEWLFQGIERMEFIGISRILAMLFYGVSVFILVKNPGQLLLIPFLWFLGNCIPVLFLIYIFTRQFGKINLRFNFSFWKNLLRQALPMGAAWIMLQIYYNFDMVMLGFMKGEKAVGLYSAAYKIILFIWAFIPIFVNVIFPSMSKYYKESQEKLQTLIISSTRLLSVAAFPLGVGGTILARPIMVLLYGQEFSGGVIAFQILIWSVVVICIRCTYEQSFLACNKEKRYLFGVIWGALTNIVLNSLLIPRFSLRGAAVATVISELVFSGYLFYYLRIVNRTEMVKHLFKPFVAAILMSFVVYYLRRYNLFLSISIGIIVYSILILLLRGVTFKEIAQFRKQILVKK